MLFKDKITCNYLEIIWNVYVIGIIHIVIFSYKIKFMCELIAFHISDEVRVWEIFKGSIDYEGHYTIENDILKMTLGSDFFTKLYWITSLNLFTFTTI